MKIACFTVAALDYFPHQKKHFAGGNALNQAVRFARSGGKVSFVGALGTDPAGDRIAALLEGSGVDVSHLYRLEGITACNELINDEYGERSGLDGAWQDGAYGEFRCSGDDWSFLVSHDIWTTHANHPDYPESLRRKTSRQFMAVDFLHLTDYDLLAESLKVADIAYFGGTADMESGLKAISAGTDKVIVLTLGGDGSIAFQRGQSFRQNALPLDKVVDTTGCGDAFQAGFTLEYFRNRDIPKALFAGAQWGRSAAGHFGGVRWDS